MSAYTIAKENAYTYKAVIKRIIDADTVEAILDLGFGLSKTAKFRIMDYDAPETYRPKSEAEREHGWQATNRAMQLLTDQPIMITTEKGPSVFGRWVAIITLPNGDDYAEKMIAEGFTKKESY